MSEHDYQRAIDALRELMETRLRYERALTDEQLAAQQTALSLQAKEYERRLTELNHAHERAVVEQARVLPREIHESFIKEYESFRIDTAKQLQAAQTRSVTWAGAIGIGFLLASVAIQLLGR